MRKTFTLKIQDHIHEPLRKRYFNAKMFTEIAPGYDRICRIMSFNADSRWKRMLIGYLPPVESPFCLDMACGTGDLSFLLAQKYSDAQVLGIDLTGSMLQLAEDRNRYGNVTFLEADMSDVPLADASVDVLTGGYALRNAPELETALREIHRLLKPGGIAGFLDFSRPANRLLSSIEYGLLKTWTGFWGIIFHRNNQLYSYIAESLRLFPDSTALKGMLREAGFEIIRAKRFCFGITEMLIVRKVANKA